MSGDSTLDPNREPFRVLGLPADAGEKQVRQRYLELVRQFPPEHEPERFQEIHGAYLAAKDPLVIARRLLQSVDEEPAAWSDILDRHQSRPPKLSREVLLSLGNRRDGAEQ